MSDDHNTHITAHQEMIKVLVDEHMKAMSQRWSDILILGQDRSDMTVEHWLSTFNISESNRLAYPNARTAYEIQTSPLAKELA